MLNLYGCNLFSLETPGQVLFFPSFSTQKTTGRRRQEIDGGHTKSNFHRYTKGNYASRFSLLLVMLLEKDSRVYSKSKKRKIFIPFQNFAIKLWYMMVQCIRESKLQPRVFFGKLRVYEKSMLFTIVDCSIQIYIVNCQFPQNDFTPIFFGK